ncbi:MAG TPA: aldo/keto reductase [Minicystis sp.]|nr:aldo/keto reductase [Minicystis sp.]
MGFGWDKVVLGRTGLRVSRLGIGTSGGLTARDLGDALDRGVNYFYWGSLRKAAYGRAVRELARTRRDEMVVVVQSYTRAAFYMRRSLASALSKLGLDQADLLLLGWWNDVPPQKILDAAFALKEAGKAKHVMVSCHHRPTFAKYIADPRFGAIMVRYNAAHPGAEQEVFPHLPSAVTERPGVVSYTATRWGALLDPALIPEGEPRPRASDCYRFALTNPHVDVTLSGPKDRSELDEAMAAIERGPMDADELAWMKRVGKVVRAASASKGGNLPVTLLDRFFGGGAPREGAT